MSDTSASKIGPSSRPLLVFGHPESSTWQGPRQGRPRLHTPTPGTQATQHGPAFRALAEATEAQRAALQATHPDVDPELVVVFDIAETVERFINAVKEIEGMEFLADLDEDEIPPDEDFFLTEKNQRVDSALGRSLYLVMTNTRAITELLSLWGRWCANPQMTFDRGYTPWRHVFLQLRDLRRWGPQDRIRETGVLDDWQARVTMHPQRIPAEIELWFRSDTSARDRAESAVIHAVEEVGGQTLGAMTLPEIGYHAIAVDLPVAVVEQILADQTDHVSLLVAEQIMFVSPVAQLSGIDPQPISEQPSQWDKTLPVGEPVVALLDGLPLASHATLDGRLIVDDPDDVSSSYPTKSRRHGTAMSSIICHGDLSNPGKALPSPLYVRPVLMPDVANPDVETIGRGRFAVDIIHRAVRRLFEYSDGQAPAAPKVKVINLSLGDSARPFIRRMSPLARLVDWLAAHYNVLIIVSAGNQDATILLPSSHDAFSALDESAQATVALRAMNDRGIHRRLLSPAEALNALTVGAAHDDGGTSVEASSLVVDLIPHGPLPAPYSPTGPGFRRSIKPEILLPGGRLRYRPPFVASASPARYDQITTERPPGVLVAIPGSSGSLSALGCSTGTSIAAAFGSRAAGFGVHSIEELRTDDGLSLDDQYTAVLANALVVHAAEWGTGAQTLRDALDVDSSRSRSHLARLFGYGVVDPDFVGRASAHRATLIGAASISDHQTQTFRLPLPPLLQASTEWRRLTITLAWFSPVVYGNRLHRVARLWVDPPTSDLRVSRQQVDWQASKRGTVQHEILEGNQAAVFNDGDTLKIDVTCRCDIGNLEQPVRFGLAVSLEVSNAVQQSIYDQIRDRLRTVVRV